MNKKTTILLLLILLIGALFMNSTHPVYAASEDGLYENIEDAANESGDNNLINFRDNYEIDTEKISFFKDPSSVIFNMATNFIFTLQKDLSKLLIVVYDFSMDTSISSILETFIEPLITGMKDTIFQRFAVFMISICAFWYLLKIISNRQSQVFSNILSLIAIIVIAFAFFAYPVQLLKGLDDISSELSNTVMDAPYDTIDGSSELGDISSKGKSSAVIWNLFVHKPWQIIEFGSVSKAQEHENDILSLKPGSDERKELVQEIADNEELFSKSLVYQSGRCATAVILLIINIFLIVILILLCILILGYQFLLLLYMMIGIFVFLLALIPYYGMELVKRWGMKLLGTACMKVLLVFFLSVLMVFMSVLYGYTDRFGLLCTMLIIVVMVSMIYLKKDEIIGLFSEFNLGSVNLKTPEQMMNRGMDQDLNVINQIRNSKGGGEYKRTNGETNIQNNDSENVVGNMTSTKENTSQFKDLRDSTENISKSVQDMSKYFVKAEDLLQRSYEKSKAESEEKAVRNNTDVEYGNFVNRTDAIREMGIGAFDPRDLSSVANIVRSVEQKGGDVDKIIDTKSDYLNKPEIKRPENVQEKLTSDQRSTETPIRMRAGSDYFTNAFGNEKGEVFYENMKRKYNPQVVENFRSQEQLTYSQIQRQLKTLSQEQERLPNDLQSNESEKSIKEKA